MAFPEHNPYVGPRPIRAGDPFFGREKEVPALRDLLLLRRLVLVHSTTGAGKTSLIQAGLLPAARGSFLTLPVIRLNEPVPDGEVGNRYLMSAMLSIERGADLPEERRLSLDRLRTFSSEPGGLAAFINLRLPDIHQPGEGDKPGKEKERVLLVFDQFEEILTLNPRDQDAKHAFFRGLFELFLDPRFWALFAMREDFVAGLEPYRQYLPDRLSARFRLEMLSTAAAQQAMIEPARRAVFQPGAPKGVEFQPDAAAELALNLSKVSVQQADFVQSVPGAFVDPILLQVVCDRLWRERVIEDRITLADVKRLKIENALQDYYNQIVQETLRQTGRRERDLRDWVEFQLISPQRLRSQAILGEERKYGLDEKTLRVLEQLYLVRLEPRRGITFCELAHDRVVEPVREANQAWRSSNAFYVPRSVLGIDLEQTGWGVIFADDADVSALRQALQPLLDLRREQATKGGKNYYREFSGAQGYRKREGERAQAFLERNGAGLGIPDREKVPFYLLIAGSPEQIPFEFQQELDMQYSVGRLSFDDLKGYEIYAKSVVACETQDLLLPNRMVIFAPRHKGDATTAASAGTVAAPLRKRLAGGLPNWEVTLNAENYAGKNRLVSLMSEEGLPPVLLTLTHGLRSAEPADASPEVCGALVCQDWPGPLEGKGPLPESQYFSAADLPSNARLLGSIAFLFAPYSAGQLEFDEYSVRAGQAAQRLSEKPLMARLPQRLLSHPNGAALAVIGLTGSAWLHYFDGLQDSQVRATFDETLQRLARGYTAGMALEPFNRQYAWLTARLTDDLQASDFTPDPSHMQSQREMKQQIISARQFVLLGDPAARLPVDPEAPFREPDPGWQRPTLASPGVTPALDGAAAPVGARLAPRGVIAQVENSTMEAKAAEPASVPRISAASPGKEINLELAIHRQPGLGDYTIEMRYSSPEADVDTRVTASFSLDLDALRFSADMKEYGSRLSQSIFEDPRARSFFIQVQAVAAAANARLRLLLLVDSAAPELQALRWETLMDLERMLPVATDENIRFSRYMVSMDWRPVQLRPQGDLRALVVVPAPADLEQYNLAEVDVEAETALVLNALGGIRVETLHGGGAATLENLTGSLREGIDILYLVAVCMVRRETPWLFLEGPDGNVERVNGSELASRIAELPTRPRLVVLVPPQSSGRRAQDGLSAIGPRLAEAGVPAVLAVQDNLESRTLQTFLPVFFRELQRDGDVVRAVSAARTAIRDTKSWWVPVLYTRLKTGRLWYQPGFSADRKAFQKWPSILRSIERNECLPILGPGLLEPLVGSSADLARSLVEEFRYPFSPGDELPRVAQYLETENGQMYARDVYLDRLRTAAQNLFKDQLPEELRSPKTSLSEVLAEVGRYRRKQDPGDPYRVLASLPLSMYVTANADTLLEDALLEQGREPVSRVFPWNDRLSESAGSENDEEYRPSSKRPLIYHLFGVWNEPDTLVLTETDYYQFLMSFSRKNGHVPVEIRRAMSGSAGLWLGHRQQDFSFRVLFEALRSLPGSYLRNRYTSIFVGLEPEQDLLDPKKVARYYEEMLGRDSIDVYWGRPEDFLQELFTQWRKESA